MSAVKTRDHRKAPPKPEDWTNPSLARITTETDATSKAGLVRCSCGWSKFHERVKVAEDAAVRHIERRHDSRAIWL